ncbi:sodium/proton-translocating pyrophosphatase [Devriesea agamarum]|uniref:sodium/proton-translocating pyrophosphatase n=1 Tax=Devriesea agamarum TaxID=472569 RepID=UPI00071D3A8A|nr:sodium/proton-translocating pyrophosphatase [Devriesea agamarum]
MDIINHYAMGGGMAWALIVTGLIAIVAIVLGLVLLPRAGASSKESGLPETSSDDSDVSDGQTDDVPTDGPRSASDTADDEESADSPAGNTAALVARVRGLGVSTVAVSLLVAVPAALLLLLVAGTWPERFWRSGMLLAGVVIAFVTSRHGAFVLTSAGNVPVERRAGLVGRIGGAFVLFPLGLASLVPVIVVLILNHQAATALLAFAAGTAVVAVASRAVDAFASTAADSSALLVGTSEHQIARDSASNPGSAHVRVADVVAGAGRSADVVMLAAAVLGLGYAAGIGVMGVEGVLVPFVVAGVAMVTAILSTFFTLLGVPGRERGALRLGSLLPTGLGLGGAVAATMLWLPSTFPGLHFAQAGQKELVVGGYPMPYSELWKQAEQMLPQIPQLIERRTAIAGAFEVGDVVTLSQLHPHLVAGLAVVIGAVIALIAQFSVAYLADRRFGLTLQVARTTRTGASLPVLGAFGLGGVIAGVITVLMAVAFVVLNVLAGGVDRLAIYLAVLAAGGAMLVLAGHAAFHTISALVDREGSSNSLRDAAHTSDTQVQSGLRIGVVFLVVGVLGLVARALVIATQHAKTLLEEHLLVDFSISSLGNLAGLAIGLVAALFAGAAVMNAARRIAAGAVLDTRVSLLEDGSGVVHLDDLSRDAHKAALVPLVLAFLTPVIVGFGIGAVPLAYSLAGMALGMLVITLWMGASASTWSSSLRVVESGRYGGPGSWAHTAALDNAVLATGLRGSIGRLAVPSVLLSALSAVLVLPAVIQLATNGTNIYLRIGIAVLALAIVFMAYAVADTIAEPDLEDLGDTLDDPLFARDVDEDDEHILLANTDAGRVDFSEDELSEAEDLDSDAWKPKF